MCGQVGVALAPFRYCYACLSRFGTSTQVTMLMLAYNPTLPEGVVQRVLGRQCSEAVISGIYQSVQALVEEEIGHSEEAARSQAEQWVRALPDCCIHTPNSVISRTVYPDPQDETMGFVLLARGQVPVFVVEGTQRKHWATSLSHARYPAHVRGPGSKKGR
jgi:hypothetical protein